MTESPPRNGAWANGRATVVSAQILDRNSGREATSSAQLQQVHDRLATVFDLHGPLDQRVEPQSFVIGFPSEQTGEALDLAIECAERVWELDRPIADAALAIGISTGSIESLEIAHGGPSFLGDAVVRSAVLARHAAAGAILVDLVAYDFVRREPRVVVGPKGRPVSFGKRRSVSDVAYGDVIACHEVVWQPRPLGLRRGKSAQQLRGRVDRWDDAGFGFIIGSDDRFYYADNRYLVGDVAPVAGQTVFFVPRPALQEGKNPVAAALVGVGDSLTGRVQSIHDDGELFVRVTDRRKNVQDLFQHAESTPFRFSRGDRVRFEVREESRGPVAEYLEPLEASIDGGEDSQSPDTVGGSLDIDSRRTAGRGKSRAPLGTITFDLPINDLSVAALELVRDNDTIALRHLLNDAETRARVSIRQGEIEELDDLLDRLICLDATFLEYGQSDWFREVVDVLVDIYAMPLKEGDVRRFGHATQISHSEIAPRVWLSVVERVFALGGLAVRRREWEAVRDLTLQLPEPIAAEGYDKNWLRHALTMASRAHHLEVGEKQVSLLSLARDDAARLERLRSDGLGSDEDDLLTSIAQFDVLSNVVAIGDTRLVGFDAGRVYYPNFARGYSHRILPIVERLLLDQQMRQTLFPLGDDELAIALDDIGDKARQDGWRYDGFVGWEGTAVAQFIAENLPEASQA